MTNAEGHDGHDALWKQLRSRVSRERGARAWLRARPTRVRILCVFAVAAVVAGAVLLWIPRSDLAALSVGGGVLRLALFAVGIGGVAALFLRTLARAAPRGLTVSVVALAGLLLPALWVALGPLHGDLHAHPESFRGGGDDFWPRALACLLFGMALGAPIFVALRLLDRDDGISWPDLLLLAGSVGLVGNLALLFHCPLVGAGHLLAGHATVPLGALLLLSPAARRRPAAQGPPDSTK